MARLTQSRHLGVRADGRDGLRTLRCQLTDRFVNQITVSAAIRPIVGWVCDWFRSQGRGVVEKRTLQKYQRMSPDDQRTFDSWVHANAVFGSILAVGMLAMALAGTNSVGRPDAAIADSLKSSNVAMSK
jgi:hypothetical protein